MHSLSGNVCNLSGGSRNSKKGYPLVVGPRRMGQAAQPPADNVLILKVLICNLLKFYLINYVHELLPFQVIV